VSKDTKKDKFANSLNNAPLGYTKRGQALLCIVKLITNTGLLLKYSALFAHFVKNFGIGGNLRIYRRVFVPIVCNPYAKDFPSLTTFAGQAKVGS